MVIFHCYVSLPEGISQYIPLDPIMSPLKPIKSHIYIWVNCNIYYISPWCKNGGLGAAPHLLYLHPHTFAQPRPTWPKTFPGETESAGWCQNFSKVAYVYVYIYHMISYYIILYYIRLYIMYYILYIVYCILYIVYYILYYIIPYYNICIYSMKYNIHIYNTTYIIYSATIINCIYNYSTLYGYRERERGRCLDVGRTEVGSHLCIFPRRSSYKGS